MAELVAVTAVTLAVNWVGMDTPYELKAPGGVCFLRFSSGPWGAAQDLIRVQVCWVNDWIILSESLLAHKDLKGQNETRAQG